MQNVQIIDDSNLATVEGGSVRAWVIIGAVTLLCPALGAGMAVGYIINS